MQLLLHLRGIYCTFCSAIFFLRALITVVAEVAKKSKHALLNQMDRYQCEKKTLVNVQLLIQRLYSSKR